MKVKELKEKVLQINSKFDDEEVEVVIDDVLAIDDLLVIIFGEERFNNVDDEDKEFHEMYNTITDILRAPLSEIVFRQKLFLDEPCKLALIGDSGYKC